MKKITVFLLLITFLHMPSFGQIQVVDSSLEIVPFWSLGDSYNYQVDYHSLKLNTRDTTANAKLSYDLIISIVDSSINSYTIRWTYTNFQFDFNHQILDKYADICDSTFIDIQVDLCGTILSYPNRHDVKLDLRASFNLALDELYGPDRGITYVKDYNFVEDSKVALIETVISDVKQYYKFYGEILTINEPRKNQMLSVFVYSDGLIDTEYSVELYELEDNCVRFGIRSRTELNSDQLTDGMYEYTKQFEFMNRDFPSREKFQRQVNVEEIATRMNKKGCVLETVFEKVEIVNGERIQQIREMKMN